MSGGGVWVLRFLPQESFPLVVVLALVQHTAAITTPPNKPSCGSRVIHLTSPACVGTGGIQGSAIADSSPVNVFVCFLLFVYRIVARSEIVGSKGKRICNLDAVRSNERSHQAVLSEVESTLLPASVRIPSSPQPCQLSSC